MRQHRLPDNIFTVKQIAGALSVSRATVYRHLPRYALQYSIEDIYILHSRGLSVRDIAFVLSAPRSTIQRVLSVHHG